MSNTLTELAWAAQNLADALYSKSDKVAEAARHICELRLLVETAYREGFLDGYDDDARPQDADSGWEHSDVRKQLEQAR